MACTVRSRRLPTRIWNGTRRLYSSDICQDISSPCKRQQFVVSRYEVASGLVILSKLCYLFRFKLRTSLIFLDPRQPKLKKPTSSMTLQYCEAVLCVIGCVAAKLIAVQPRLGLPYQPLLYAWKSVVFNDRRQSSRTDNAEARPTC